ncbi:epoxide hydrolase family protein [Dactylosporangium sucinum]|uniref:Microsomal epoxide hydrolase n=1 Tax=Dactylosporangium sucinum TaxID=1424081 RepID=A0A917TUT5_9ACTN|nr:epoxide hydrolase family protein [Dactylosporangium sucinum]GGM38465.1 microsomal epoxide hydrolase [Dactylosporangium sucinum]
MTIRSFQFAVPQADLDDLRNRIRATRWAAQLPGGEERGLPVDVLRELAEYWAEGYDWRKQEALLNEHPQYTVEIQGQPVHFLHVRSPHPHALPLVLLHGWPGSFADFLDVIGPLTTDERDPFHVMVPSLPGFGPSTPLAGEGWGARRVAGALAELMALLGYDRYGVQGGDIGAIVGPDLGRVATGHVAGVHVNAATVGFIPFGPVDEDGLTDAERERVAGIQRFQTDGNGYFQLQATRPQTLAHALTDSPVGQLAWILEKVRAWSNEPIDRDRILTGVMLYWLFGAAGSAANIYYELMHSGDWPTPSGVPTGVAVFPGDLAIRRYAEQANTVTHWSEPARGGHFAALEAADLLVDDVRGFFRDLR